jgi:hypothetical protein
LGNSQGSPEFDSHQQEEPVLKPQYVDELKRQCRGIYIVPHIVPSHCSDIDNNYFKMSMVAKMLPTRAMEISLNVLGKG